MYGCLIGEVIVYRNFDEYMIERVEEAFADNDKDDIEIEEDFSSDVIYVKSTKLEDDDLISILADNGIEAERA